MSRKYRRLRILRTQRQDLLQLFQRTLRVLAVRQRDRKIKVIIRIPRIGGNRLLIQRAPILAPTARRHALVIHDFRQRQAHAHKRKRILRLAIIARVEAGQATIEIRLQRIGIVFPQTPQRRRRLLIVLIGEV